jgi:Galactose oxidase, central domain/Kelch motif
MGSPPLAPRNLQFSWQQLAGQPDPDHGLPCTRSSHGVSVIAANNAATTTNASNTNKILLLVYGGEHVARTPIHDEANCVWTYRYHDQGGETTNQWQRITCTGGGGGDDVSTTGMTMIPPARVAHAQALYQNRYLYVFGGRSGIEMQEQAMNDMWVLDTETYEWNCVTAATTKESDSAPEARSFHRMICIGHALYVFGGCGATHGRLADLHRFDIPTRTWEAMGISPLLRGRGGPNLVALDNDTKLAVIAGFAGEETADGHVFDLVTKTWSGEDLTNSLKGMRPRSVCVSCSLPSLGVVLVFGGEVDPSDRGHEGAGGFENDLVVLDSKTGALLETFKATSSSPNQRGWADADSVDNGSGGGQFFVFGGLTGDDTHPVRLNDLWKLEISTST